MADRTARHNQRLPVLPVASRLRAAFHVLRTGDYQPATAYLRGVHDGLDRGFAMAWDKLQRRFPDIGAAPEVPVKSYASTFLEP